VQETPANKESCRAQRVLRRACAQVKG